MRPNEKYAVMYYYKGPDAAASPRAPSPTTDSAMFWGLNERIDNTEKQTRELSSQSERQIRLIQAITKSQNQHEREQHEAMTSLFSRIQQNEQHIQGLHNAAQALSTNQQQTDQTVQLLQAELEALKKQVAAQQLQQQRRSVLRNGAQMQELRQDQQQQHFPRNGGPPVVDEPGPGAVFTDVYLRRRRLCRYCGENLAAAYCLRHEKNKVCRR